VLSYVFAPFVWTGLEYASCLGSLAFPWNSLSTALTRIPALIQVASLTGAQGVSFWIVGVNVLVFFLIRGVSDRKRLCALLLCFAAMVAVPLVYGLAALSRSEPKGRPSASPSFREHRSLQEMDSRFHRFQFRHLRRNDAGGRKGLGRPGGLARIGHALLSQA